MTEPLYDDLMKLSAVLQPRIMNEDGEHPFVIVPDGFKVENRSTKLPAPTRIRQKVKFSETKSFLSYAKEYGSEAAKLFGDRETLSVTAALDFHQKESPSFCTHTATLQLKHSREWKVWSEQSGKPMDQTVFAHFLESNIQEIQHPAGAEILEIASTLEAKKGLKFKSGVNLVNGQRTFIYEEDLQAKAGREGKLLIPDRFKLALRPFDGADPFEVEALFRYRILDGDLKLWFELVRPDKVLEAAFALVLNEIAEALGREVLSGSL